MKSKCTSQRGASNNRLIKISQPTPKMIEQIPTTSWVSTLSAKDNITISNRDKRDGGNILRIIYTSL